MGGDGKGWGMVTKMDRATEEERKEVYVEFTYEAYKAAVVVRTDLHPLASFVALGGWATVAVL